MKNKKILISLIASLSIVSCSGGGGSPYANYDTSNRFPKATTTVVDNRGNEKAKYLTENKVIEDYPLEKIKEHVKFNPNFPYSSINLNNYNEGTRIGGNESKHIKTIIDGREVEYNTVSELIHNTNYDNPFDRGLGHNGTNETGYGVKLADPNTPYINFNNPLNLPEVGANTKYTGKGVNVGVVDTGFWSDDGTEYKKTHDALDNIGMKYTVKKINFGELYGKYNNKNTHGIEVSKVAFDIAKNADFALYDIQSSGEKGGSYTSLPYLPKKYDIINLSMGTETKENLKRDHVDTLRYELQKGSLVVQAAGNSLDGEVNYENFTISKDILARKGHILVGGLTTYPNYKNPKYLTQEELKHFSPSTPEGKYHFITAMGQMEISSGGWFWGTSGATPTVTGIAALVKEKYPWMTNENLKMTLLTTATDIGEKGVDVIYGWGLVNADRALNGPKY